MSELADLGNSASISGRYEPFASLGRGGMADVYLATTTGLGGFAKLVVIKMLRAEIAQEPQFREMFLYEARLAARLNHPNVVNTFEVGEQNGVYFIAMEYLEGQPLNRVLQKVKERGRPLSPRIVARVMADALAGLRHAHTLRDYDGQPLQIIHRDVSPHNIFVTYDGHVKLVDFGIAKAALGSHETEVGVTKGKVAYMAPEQAFGGPIDARADVFSLGVVLWEMLTRRKLMSGRNAAENIHRLINEGIPSASSVSPDVPPLLDAIAARALEKQPDDRFASAAEMLDALEGYLAMPGNGVRQDEVGELIAEMFGEVRDDVQKRIRRHIDKLAAADAHHLTVGSLRNVDALATTGNGGLLNLGGAPLGSTGSNDSGSGNSSIPSQSPPPTTTHTVVPAGGRSLLLVLLGALSMLVLIGAAIIAFGIPHALPGPPPAASPVPVVVDAPPVAVVPPAIASAPVAAPTPPRAVERATSDAPAAPPRRGARGSARTPAPPPAPSEPRAPAKSQDEGTGYFTVETYPWTNVSVDGRSIGMTPIVRAPLPTGNHTVRFENSEQGISQSQTITIAAGETLSKRIGLK